MTDGEYICVHPDDYPELYDGEGEIDCDKLIARLTLRHVYARWSMERYDGYGVPAKRGRRVRIYFDDGRRLAKIGRITSASHYIHVDGSPFHPTEGVLEDEDWEAAFLHQREVVAGALVRAADLVPRFAIFSIAPIPLIIHLGFLFSDRVETDLFQFDRDRGDWRWPDEQSETAGQVPELVGEPESEVASDGDAVLRVSLSELVRAADTRAVVPSPLVELAIGIDDPDKQWLQSPDQLSHLRELYLAALKSIRRKVPGCGRLHVFYAGPAAGAFLLGQCVNPRMDPEIAVYEYSRQREPRYRLASVLAEEGAL